MAKVTTNTVLTNATVGGGITLRHPGWSEFDAWVELRRANAKYLQPWEPEWSKDHLARSTYRARMGRFKKMVAQDETYPFHVFRNSDNRLIGACNLIDVRRKVAQRAALGYWIGEDYVRQGFARAAVRTVCQFAFEQLGLHRIEAAIQSDNLPSVKVVEAAGFTREGTSRDYLKINGQWRDHDIYARLNSDS